MSPQDQFKEQTGLSPVERTILQQWTEYYTEEYITWLEIKLIKYQKAPIIFDEKGNVTFRGTITSTPKKS
jgi:hypothetical protein